MTKILRIASIAYAGTGAALVLAGIGGAALTWRSVARERIVTPEDAAIPGTPVRGPLTLMAQAGVIRKHVLEMTGGRTYAEMPRQVPRLDQSGAPVLDSSGAPVLVPNEAREIWVTATALTAALDLAVLAYALSALSVVLGLVLLGTGLLVRQARKERQRA